MSYCLDCREEHECFRCDECKKSNRKDDEFADLKSAQFHRDIAAYMSQPMLVCQVCNRTGENPREVSAELKMVDIASGLSMRSAPGDIVVRRNDANECSWRTI